MFGVRWRSYPFYKLTSKFNIMRIILLLSLGLCLVFSCNSFEEIEVPEYDAEFAVPIIENASIRFPDLWQNDDPNQSLVIESDGRIVYKYKSPKAVVETLDLLPTLTVLLMETVPENSNKVPISSSIPIDLIIREAQIIGGVFLLTFETDAPPSANTNITFSIPEITKDGVPLEIETNTLTNSTPLIDLTGYVISPTDNQLTINYEAVNQAGVPQELYNITMSSTPQVQVLKGFLGQQIQTIPPDIIPIDLYDDRFLNGTLRFAEPRISAIIENAFGVPVRSQIDLLNAHRTDGEIVPIEFDAIDQIDIGFPSIMEIGSTKFTELYLDHTNSNIADVFNGGVTAIEYGLSAIINPENDSTLTSFLTDTSFFTVEVLVEIPMVISSNNFIANETYDFAFNDIGDIEKGEFKLIVENELPLEAGLQLYFIDAGGMTIDSLFQEVSTLIQGAPVDTEGNADGFSETITFIPVSAAQIQRIQQAQQLQVKANFKTSGSLKQPVTILADQEIRFRMGLRFKV